MTAETQHLDMECTRDRIVAAAARLIHRQGFGATTIDDILAEADVKKGSLYHYFPSKDDLGLAVLDTASAWALQGLKVYLGDNSQAPTQRISNWMGSIRDVLSANSCRAGCPFGNLALEMSDISEAFRLKLMEHFGAMQTALAETIRAGQMLGSIDPGREAERDAAYIVTLLQGAIMMSKVTRNTIHLDRTIEQVMDRLQPAQQKAA